MQSLYQSALTFLSRKTHITNCIALVLYMADKYTFYVDN